MNVIEKMVAISDGTDAVSYSIFVPTKNSGMVLIASGSGDVALAMSDYLRILQGYYWAEQKNRLFRDEHATNGVADVIMVEGAHTDFASVANAVVLAKGSDYLDQLPDFFGERLPEKYYW